MGLPGNTVIAIIIIVLFVVLAGISFGIWRLVHMVRNGWGSEGSSSSRSTGTTTDLVDP